MYYIYILSNTPNTVLYVGVTRDLYKRMYQHQNKLIKGFTTRYNVSKLIYYEEYKNINEALVREKQLKGWKREWKVSLVLTVNPKFRDLYNAE